MMKTFTMAVRPPEMATVMIGAPTLEESDRASARRTALSLLWL
jgi:hypothetical protein